MEWGSRRIWQRPQSRPLPIELDVVISLGPAPVTIVPDVLQARRNDAIKVIEESNLKEGKITLSPSRDVAAGLVIRQDP
jgi:beta-lactam-binding protein with PASTA domain